MEKKTINLNSVFDLLLDQFLIVVDELVQASSRTSFFERDIYLHYVPLKNAGIITDVSFNRLISRFPPKEKVERFIEAFSRYYGKDSEEVKRVEEEIRKTRVKKLESISKAYVRNLLRNLREREIAVLSLNDLLYDLSGFACYVLSQYFNNDIEKLKKSVLVYDEDDDTLVPFSFDERTTLNKIQNESSLRLICRSKTSKKYVIKSQADFSSARYYSKIFFMIKDIDSDCDYGTLSFYFSSGVDAVTEDISSSHLKNPFYPQKIEMQPAWSISRVIKFRAFLNNKIERLKNSFVLDETYKLIKKNSQLRSVTNLLFPDSLSNEARERICEILKAKHLIAIL